MQYRLWLHRWLWACWWIGTAVIVASWIGWVPNSIGWIGFGAACASTLISTIVNRYWRIPSAQDFQQEQPEQRPDDRP